MQGAWGECSSMASKPSLPDDLVGLMQMSYSKFINGLGKQNIELNRKVLSELAMNEPFSFKALVEQVKWMRG
jgi:hypothetical protein